MLKSYTWTPKVCRIIVAFYRIWAIILPTLGGLGSDPHSMVLGTSILQCWGLRGKSGGADDEDDEANLRLKLKGLGLLLIRDLGFRAGFRG